MTKHIDEVAVKGHIGLDEPSKIFESTTEIVCKEALISCSAHVNSLQESQPKVMPVKIRVGQLRTRLGRIMQRLYDLEPGGKSERPLNIDLDLYQMENY